MKESSGQDKYHASYRDIIFDDNEDDKLPSSDKKAKARAHARASRPGAVAVAADEVSRLDQRIAGKSTPEPPALDRLEQDIQAKHHASSGVSDEDAEGKPGVFSVRNSSFLAPAALERLEDRIAAKTRSATSAPSAQASLNNLEYRIQAKVRGEALARKLPAVPDSPRQPGTLVMNAEERMQAKIRRDGGGGRSTSAVARAQLQGLEDSTAAKQQEYVGVARASRQNEVSRLDERIAAKNVVFTPAHASSGLNTPPPASAPATVLSPAGLKKGDTLEVDGKAVAPSKKTDDDPQSTGDKVDFDDYHGGDPLVNPHQAGGSDFDYGVAENPEGLAVAIPVVEEDQDVFIPSAVEFDPDAKPPLYRNRRFRLYAFLAVIVLAMVAVGAGVGSRLSKDEDGPASIYAHRENLGIEEAIERTVGAENLQDEMSPFSRALRWIMYHDPQQLVPEVPNFIQRFILAYVYYATTADKPWLSCNPPTEEEPDSCLMSKIQWLYPISRVDVPGIRWNSRADECQWAGVVCDEFNQTRSIDLFGNNLTGHFPVGVVHLPYLQSVSVSWNQMYGTLPKEIFDMPHLVSVEFHANAFTGTIPDEWWESRSLQRLNVGRNQLEGHISTKVQNLRDAKGLFIFDNMMTGTLPTVLGMLKSLTYFRGNQNFLHGTIPTELGSIGFLESFWGNDNDFSGTIPSELGMVSVLGELRLSNNPRLTGEFPDEVLDTLSTFEVANCSFYGNLTEKLPLMKSMRYLKLQDNFFTGQIPEDLGNELPNLVIAWLHGNLLTGSVPESVCNVTTLKELVADCGGENPEIFCPDGCCTECCVEGEECLK